MCVACDADEQISADRWQIGCRDLSGRYRSFAVSADGARIVLGLTNGESACLTIDQALKVCMRLARVTKVAWYTAFGADSS